MFSLRLHTKFSSSFARITVVAFCYVAYSSTATALVPSTIYVSEGIYSTSPYSFFENSDLTGDLYITSGGADTLLISETYTFVKNTSSHPFYISDQGYRATSSAKLTISGDGSHTSGIVGGRSLTLSFNNFDPESDTLSYYCSSHPIMVGAFNVSAVPEPSSYAAIFGLMALSMVLTRRKIRV